MRTVLYALVLVVLNALALMVPTTAQVSLTPTITSISPKSVVAGQYARGGAPLVVLITGNGFGPKTTAHLADGEVLTVRVDATGTLAKVSLPVALLQDAIKRKIFLVNPSPAASASIGFDILARIALARPTPAATLAPTRKASVAPTPVPTVAPTPKPTVAQTPAPAPAGVLPVVKGVPTLTSVTPAEINIPNFDYPVKLTGTGFVPNSVAYSGTLALSTAYASATSLSVTIPSYLLARAGTVPITVMNPAPGGGTSVAQNLVVANVVPSLSAIEPSSLLAWQNAVFTLIGVNFVPGAVVAVGGLKVPTAFVSPTQLTVSLLPPLPLGILPVTVTNPGPGGAASNPITIQIDVAQPMIVSVTPPSSIVPGQTMTIAGGSFAPLAVVLVNGTRLATTVQSENQGSETFNQVTATLPASAALGAASIVVENPAISTAPALDSQPYHVEISNPVPVITSMSSEAPWSNPTTVWIHSTQDPIVTVTGTGFIAKSQITLDGIAIAPTFVNSSTLRFTVPTSIEGGWLPLFVSNPAPGGGMSSPPVTLDVTTPPWYKQ